MTKYRWINRWIGRDLSGLHLLLAFFGCGCYAAGCLLPDNRLRMAGQYGIFILILIHLLHMHYHGCHQFLSVHLDSERIPKAQMKQVNGIYMTLFLGMTAVCMALLPALWGKPVWETIKQVLRMLVMWLISLIPKTESVNEPAAMPPANEPWPMFGEEAPAASPFIMKLLDLLAGITAIAAICFILVFLCCRLYRLLCRILAPKEYDDDEKQFLLPELLTSPMPKAESLPLWRDFSTNGKIRRMYKRKIRKLAAGKIHAFSSATPSEIEHAAGLLYHRETYHDLYEKARYGQNPVSKEELERLISETKREERAE